jgi:hypothetical protein
MGRASSHAQDRRSLLGFSVQVFDGVAASAWPNLVSRRLKFGIMCMAGWKKNNRVVTAGWIS